ncbi:MAG: NAD-dependent epimerase/dehydratase family protein [Candidatus Methanomethyliaceae archaeon]
MVKVAVAGGYGFLGSRVVARLREKGYNAVPFSRRTGVDIRIYDRVLEFLKTENPEVVINNAAHVGGIAYNAINPVEIFEDNMLIGLNIVRASYEAGVMKLVNIMPNCTYPGIADTYVEGGWWDGPMHETVLAYGMPRKALWVQCWAYKAKYGFNSIHVVLPNLYGPNDHFDPVRSHALGALVRKVVDAKLRGERKVVIWGTGTPVREWLYVDDAAEGVVVAMEKYNDVDILNIGQGKGYTITEIAHMIKEAVSWDGEFEFDLSKPDGAPKKVLDVGRMRTLLGWEPKTNIREGIERTVAWYMRAVAGGTKA